ncbi:MAG TPA: hypothetical protein VFA67_01200 [Candidatus Sulfotelmatobacter sp.]|nr:hypothetical protein [Candidatus Sulfotelmatobacter sp.]
MKRREGRRGGIGKTILLMAVMAAVCSFTAAHLYDLAVKVGMRPATASKLPTYALFLGMAMGVAIARVGAVKEIFKALAAMFALGALCWFAGVVLGGILVACGVSDEAASRVAVIGFIFGMLVGSIVVYAVGHDIAGAALTRFRARGR